MLGSMKVHIVFLALLALALPNLPLRAQPPVADQVVRADQLRNQDQPKAAVAILEPLLQAKENGLAGDDLGFAWNVLGSSYQDLQRYAEAEKCYETALAKLKPMPTAQAKYASAIANLASLEDVRGQRDSAKALYEKSNRIYESLGDSGGVAITSTNLAMLAFTRKDFKTAHRYLAIALEQGQRTTGLRDDDFAALYSVQSVLALHDGRYGQAIACVQQSIDLWTHAHGPNYFMLGLGYALSAQAIAKSGDYPRALSDVQHALTIIEATAGKDTAPYLRTQIIHAEILGAAGSSQEASRLKREASSSLAVLESRQCGGCTINANGFRGRGWQ